MWLGGPSVPLQSSVFNPQSSIIEVVDIHLFEGASCGEETDRPPGRRTAFRKQKLYSDDALNAFKRVHSTRRSSVLRVNTFPRVARIIFSCPPDEPRNRGPRCTQQPHIGDCPRAIRADTQVHPYVDRDEMNMIRHTHKFIAPDVRKFIFQFGIPPCDHSSGIVRLHFPFHNMAKQTFVVLGADGRKIRPGPGIIISPQPDGTSTVDFRIIFGLFYREN